MKPYLLILVAVGVLAGGTLSPAERMMSRAVKAIQENPNRPEPYNELALALARRARETSDTSYYAKAEEALQKSFAVAPDNFDGHKARIWVLLGKHEFVQALELAKKLNRQAPDYLLVYGYLSDANAELGNYKQAEEAAQFMLDLRPGNVPGLTRGAYLRELFGYIDGAIEFMTSAYQRTNPSEAEDRAWILTQIAHLHLLRGKVDPAGQLLDQALQLFPDYHYALANLARLRTMQGKFSEAAELFRRRYEAAPHPENLYDLARAFDLAGRKQEADHSYAEFEQKARREMEIWDNSNRELIHYYAERGRKPGEALRVARMEITRRHDVFTLDAYAWALHVNGDDVEARKQIERALAVGIKEANVLYRAGAIAAAQKDRAAATAYLEKSLELNPLSESAGAARKLLSKLKPS